MTPATIIREAQADGVTLPLTPTGTIKADADGAVVNRWLAVIGDRKICEVTQQMSSRRWIPSPKVSAKARPRISRVLPAERGTANL